MAHSLAFEARTCLMPYETKECTTQIKFRPVVPDNEKYWQVFDGDKQIEDFMQFRNEFELHNLDSDMKQTALVKKIFLMKKKSLLSLLM